MLEEQKRAARFKAGREMMLEAKKNARPEERSAIIPLTLGQKMSKEEYMMNRDLLEKVAEIKK